MSAPRTRTARTMCPMNCHPTFCGMEVDIEDNRLVNVRGDKGNPDSEGFLCVRGLATREIMDNPRRVLKPLARDVRGEDSWYEISWDEALRRIVDSMQSVGRESVAIWPGHGVLSNDYGPLANLYLALRFANMYGCQWWDTCMICWGLGGFGVGLTGAMQINTKEDMGENADLIVQWGSNHASQPNTARHIAQAKKRGARVVALDVRMSDACRSAHDRFIVKPGTDAALALAMMHVIIAEDLYDAEFVALHTLGFDELRAHVAPLTPQWAAEICGVEANRIADFARDYARTERAMILIGGASMHKDANGWEAARAISCLPGLTGKLGKPGTGFGPRHAGLPQGYGFNEITNFDARPPGNYVPMQMSAIIDAFEAGDVRTLLLFGSDFATSFADAARIGRGMAQMDLVVSHDLFMNDTSRRYADIILPGTTWLEDHGAKATATHVYLMDKILEPAGEARSMTSIIRDLAERVGLDGFYPWHDDGGHIDAVLDHPATGHASIESLRANGGMAELQISHVAHTDHRYTTPSGKIEFYSKQAADSGCSPLPVHTPRAGSQDFPLELRTGRTINHFHAFYDSGRALPSLARRDKRPALWIAPGDALARDIADGDPITVYNERGTFDAHASVTDKILPGTLWIHDGWPGLNDLTAGAAAIPDAATKLFPFSTGQSAFDAFVEVSVRPDTE